MALVTWRRDDEDRRIDFLVVHKSVDGRRCDPGDQVGFVESIEISHFLGEDGQAALLSLLSPGPMIGSASTPPAIADFDQYVGLFRRLQTPWYEKARGHFGDEQVQVALAGANEYVPYRPSTLKAIATGKL